MAVSRQAKEESLKKATDVFDNSLSTVFVNFTGVGGNEIKDLRRDLNEKGVQYSVFKKTLIKIAASNSKVDGDMPNLENGEIALAYSTEEQTAPAASIKKWSKELGDKINIIGGVFEGEFKNKEEMIEIANIPSLEVLRGMFVNVINSPIQRMAIVLDQIAQTKA